jgi:hypothetical protein
LAEFKLLASLNEEEIEEAVMLSQSLLVNIILEAVLELQLQQAVDVRTVSDRFSKFAKFVFSFGDLRDFREGLDERIGAPSEQVEEEMRREHTSYRYSTHEFTSQNYGVQTTPAKEWAFVVDGTLGPGEAVKGVTTPRKPKKLEEFLQYAREHYPSVTFTRPEIIGIRLYTGPMFQAYNECLRQLKGQNEWKTVNDSWKGLFTTTLHAINSFIIKMSEVSKATRVYRGLSAGKLPESFLQENKYKVRGGIELGFMSTTDSRDVAMGYATGQNNRGGIGYIFEMQEGLVSRGADVKWVSQYPDENEKLFPPLCALNVVKSRVEGSIIVVTLSVTLNQHSLTMEQLRSRKQSLLLQHNKHQMLKLEAYVLKCAHATTLLQREEGQGREWTEENRMSLDRARKAMTSFATNHKIVEELFHQITADGAEVFHADAYFQSFLEQQTTAVRETEDALVKTLVSMLFVPVVRDETIRALSKLLQTYPELAQKAFSAREADKEGDRLKLEQAIFPALAGGGSVRVRTDVQTPDEIKQSLGFVGGSTCTDSDGGTDGPFTPIAKRLSPTPIGPNTPHNSGENIWEAFDMQSRMWQAQPEILVRALKEEELVGALGAAAASNVEPTKTISRTKRRFVSIEGLPPTHPEHAKMGVYERLEEHVNGRHLWHRIANVEYKGGGSKGGEMFLFYASYTANWQGWYIGRRENIYVDVEVQIAAAQVLRVILKSVSGEHKNSMAPSTSQQFCTTPGASDALVSALRDSICVRQLAKARASTSSCRSVAEDAVASKEAEVQKQEELKQSVLLAVINLMWRKDASVNLQCGRIDKICKAGVLDLAALLASSKNEEVQNGAVDVLSSCMWRVGGSAEKMLYWTFEELTGALARLNLPGIAHTVLTAEQLPPAGTICTLMKWPYFFAVALRHQHTNKFATDLLDALLEDPRTPFLPKTKRGSPGNLCRSTEDGISTADGSAWSPLGRKPQTSKETNTAPLLVDFAAALDPDSKLYRLHNSQGYVACNRAADALLGLVKKAQENDERQLTRREEERLRISNSSAADEEEPVLHAQRLADELHKHGATRHLLHTLRREEERQLDEGKRSIVTGAASSPQRHESGVGTTKGKLRHQPSQGVAAGEWVPKRVTVTIAHQGEHGIQIASPNIEAQELRITHLAKGRAADAFEGLRVDMRLEEWSIKNQKKSTVKKEDLLKVMKQMMPAGQRPLRLTFVEEAVSTAWLCARSLLLELARMSGRAETFVKMNGGPTGKRLLEVLDKQRAKERAVRQRKQREKRQKAKLQEEKQQRWDIIVESIGGIELYGFAEAMYKNGSVEIAFMKDADGVYVEKTEHDVREAELQREAIERKEAVAKAALAHAGAITTRAQGHAAAVATETATIDTVSATSFSAYGASSPSESVSSRAPSPTNSTSSLTSMLSTNSTTGFHFVNQRGFHLYFVQDKGWLVTKKKERGFSAPSTAYLKVEKREKVPEESNDRPYELQAPFDGHDIEDSNGKEWTATNPGLVEQKTKVSIHAVAPVDAAGSVARSPRNRD